MTAGRKLRCKKCQDVVQSLHRHDFQRCSCGAIAVDGGSDYLRVVGQLSNMEIEQPDGSFGPMRIEGR